MTEDDIVFAAFEEDDRVYWYVHQLWLDYSSLNSQVEDMIEQNCRDLTNSFEKALELHDIRKAV